MAKTLKVTLQEAQEVIEAQRETGTFFGVDAIKRTTGELRTFKAVKFNVRKFTNGVGLAFSPKEKDLFCVWESMNAEGCKEELAYRMIAKEGIKVVRANGNIYEVI